jgi:two-component system sensor histidine kinase/response regulator
MPLPAQAETVFERLNASLPATPRKDTTMDRSPTISPACRGLHVLLVDDSQLQRVAAAGVLRKHGLRVTCANDGHEAVAALKERDFDVVLMDVEMPGMSGLTATVEIRQRETLTYKYTPVVAFTSTADRESCFAVGMDGFASKPLTAADLTLISRLVTHAKLRQNARPA